MKDRLATSSATDWSPVWPMPVHTGMSELAMARATGSWSKAARSAFEPPPRTTHDHIERLGLEIVDGRGDRWWVRPCPGRRWAPR